jgi:hypothetical protein
MPCTNKAVLKFMFAYLENRDKKKLWNSDITHNSLKCTWTSHNWRLPEFSRVVIILLDCYWRGWRGNKGESSWNVMAHGDAREGQWRGNWRMEWVASTLHTTSEHGVSSITTAEAHTSAASRRRNWRPRRFKGTRLFRRKTKSGFCACAITFQLVSASRNTAHAPRSFLCSFQIRPRWLKAWI